MRSRRVKASDIYRSGDADMIGFTWLDGETAVVTVRHAKTGKRARFKARFKNGRLEQVLEDQEIEV